MTIQATNARKSLTVFFAILVPLTIIAHVLIIRNGMTLPLVAYAMWTPAISSVLTRLIRKEGFRDVSFKIRTLGMGWSLLVACCYPLVVGVLAYGGAWMTGLAEFSWSAPDAVPTFLTGLPVPVTFLIWVVLVSVLTFPISAALAFGEELGWRGFMVKRLVEARIPCPVLISGVVWGLHHVPVILTGQYGPAGSTGPAAVGPFMIGIVASGYAFAAVRLVSGSLWPAVVFHAVYNSMMQDGFDTALAESNLWLGEAGYLQVAVEVVVAVGIWCWYKRMYREGGKVDVDWGNRRIC